MADHLFVHVSCRVVSEVQARGIVSFGGADPPQWSDVVTALVDEFSQLDHRPRPEPAGTLRQLPVFVLGEKGGLHHPLWFEQATNKQDKEQSGFKSDDDDDDNEGSDIGPAEENDYFNNEEEPFNNADLTLRPIEVTPQPDQQFQLSISSTVEEAEDSVRTLETSGTLSNEWENIEEAEAGIDDGGGGRTPIVGQATRGDEMQAQLQEGATESVSSPLSGTSKLVYYYDMI